mgnify:CR=1 FL=1
MSYRIEYIDGIQFKHPSILYKYRNWSNPLHQKILKEYLQPIITQYFIDNKSEIWLLFLIAHSKR